MAKFYKAESKFDYQEKITNQLIEQIEAGTTPWQQAWDGKIGAIILNAPRNGKTDRPYTKINALILSEAVQKEEKKDARFYTFVQAKESGYGVRKGAKGHLVKQGFYATKDKNGLPLAKEDCHWTYRYSNVFHANDLCIYTKDEAGKQIIVDIPEDAKIKENVGYTHTEKCDIAEKILKASGAVIIHDQPNRAFYTMGRDEIHLPPVETFKDIEEYYATALHELSHWTGHKSRLNRDLKGGFGSADYAIEELKAEIASCYLSYEVGLPVNTMSHAAYVESWLHALKNDKSLIFKASEEAGKIVNYLLEMAGIKSKKEAA